MAETKIFRTFIKNLPKIFRKNYFFPKIVQNNFPKVSENCPKNYGELPEEVITREFYQKHFPKFYNFPKFCKTILVDVRFQFCLAAESIGQDGAILPDDQQIKLRESRAG